MAKKAKRGRVKNNQLVEEKCKELQKIWDLFQIQRSEYVTHLNMLCNNTCDKIRKMYDDKLKALPENIRNMTLSEYIEMQKKTELQAQVPAVNDLRSLTSEYTKSKLLSEKKTQKKNKTERKRSSSVSVFSGGRGIPQNLLSRTSRVLSESCLSTPYSKRSVVPSNVVTPKFNPNVPLSKNCMRKPRPGEIVMSVSGSPLQNLGDDAALSVIIKLAEDPDVAKVEAEYAKKIDADTKQLLANVSRRLQKIVQA